MYNQPFYIPRYYGNFTPIMTRGAAPGNLFMRNNFFSKIANTFSNLKNINWGGLINNTSKTLGVINQTIPLVKQVKPVMNNMRSMIRIASLFRDETDDNKKSIVNDNYTNNTVYDYNNSPTFF